MLHVFSARERSIACRLLQVGCLWLLVLTKMNPADFQGLYWYKLLIPGFTWGSILGTFLGPLLFPSAWFTFVGAFMIVFVLVSISQVKLKLCFCPTLKDQFHMPGYHASMFQGAMLCSKRFCDVLQLSRMVGMIGRIQCTIARSVLSTKAVLEEKAQRQKCFGSLLGDSSLKDSAATEPESDASVQIVVDVGTPFMHAFIIPNYKARSPAYTASHKQEVLFCKVTSITGHA